MFPLISASKSLVFLLKPWLAFLQVISGSQGGTLDVDVPWPAENPPETNSNIVPKNAGFPSLEFSPFPGSRPLFSGAKMLVSGRVILLFRFLSSFYFKGFSNFQATQKISRHICSLTDRIHPSCSAWKFKKYAFSGRGAGNSGNHHAQVQVKSYIFKQSDMENNYHLGPNPS